MDARTNRLLRIMRIIQIMDGEPSMMLRDQMLKELREVNKRLEGMR